MPITRKQFELGIDNTVEQWMKTIHAFLAEHKDEAFAREELKVHLLGERPDQGSVEGIRAYQQYQKKSQGFDEALEKLVEVSAAYEKEIRSGTYYSVALRTLEL